MESERMHPSVILYDYAMSFVGLPYIWGGDDPINGLDCSGLCIELLKSAGVFPHAEDTTADGLYRYFAAQRTKSPMFGTLVFFGSDHPTHVGFCLNASTMLEAGGGGSKTTSRADAALQNAFVRIRPISNRKDLIGYAHPPYPWK